jgi:selenocysteine lyase/cysteine desulfurase
VMTSSLMPSVRMSVSSWHGSPSSDTIFITKQANTSSSTRIRAIVLWPGKCEWRRVEPM